VADWRDVKRLVHWVDVIVGSEEFVNRAYEDLSGNALTAPIAGFCDYETFQVFVVDRPDNEGTVLHELGHAYHAHHMPELVHRGLQEVFACACSWLPVAVRVADARDLIELGLERVRYLEPYYAYPVNIGWPGDGQEWSLAGVTELMEQLLVSLGLG
jgi:hypothetical protein